MAYTNATGCGEGLSMSRPPLFDGTNFATWKNRFKIYAKSQGIKVWLAIERGVKVPTKIVEEKTVEKDADEFTTDDEEAMNLASKAEMVLTSALIEKEYKRVSNCKNAKEIWEKLIITYEGTNHIKETRKDALIQEYESFKLEEGEKIIDMETRFSRIIDELEQLGKAYTTNEKNRRILKALPSVWKMKVTAIKEMQDLTTYPLDSLIGNLRAHEVDMFVEKVGSDTDLKKKGIAFKALLVDQESDDEDLNEELLSLDNNEVALLSRQLRRVIQSKARRYGKGFLKTNNNFNNYQGKQAFRSKAQGGNFKTNNNRNIKTNENSNICFECKQPGHFKKDCPKLANNKVLVAEEGWDLSDDEKDVEQTEEVANLCLMADNDPSSSRSEVLPESSSTYSVTQILNDLSEKHHELQDAYNCLYEDNEIIKEECIKLKISLEKQNRNTINLEREKSILNIIHEDLKEELERLKNVNKNLEIENSTLIISNKNLEIENSSLAFINEENQIQNQVLSEYIQNLEIEISSSKRETEKQSEDSNLKNQIEDLTKERDDLYTTVLKFTKGKENLDAMLSQQKCGFNKEGLGYVGGTSKTKDKELYHVKSKEKESHTSPFVKCSYCNRNGHSINTCNARNGNYKGKMIWVPKGTYTSPIIKNSRKEFYNYQLYSGFNAFTSTDDPMSRFVKGSTSAPYTKWKTYPKDPSY